MTKLEAIQKFKDMNLPYYDHSVTSWTIPGTGTTVYFANRNNSNRSVLMINIIYEQLNSGFMEYTLIDGIKKMQEIIQDKIESYDKNRM